MTSHTEELERTLASDPVLTDAEHAAEVYLARTLAAELDTQVAQSDLQTRTIASYAGVLGALRRIVRDAQAQRRRESTATIRPASRLAHIQEQAARVRTPS